MRIDAAICRVLALVAVAATPAAAKWAAGAKPFASATLEAKSGARVHGKVDFAKTADEGLLVRVTVTNLAPGPHGFHVHEKGDCSAPDASSAGAHYDPTGDAHGRPDAPKRHLGDLGNLAGGEGTRTIELSIAKPDGRAWSWEDFVGKAIVVHATADDFVTQPSGNSGDRIACGVLQPVEPRADVD